MRTQHANLFRLVSVLLGLTILLGCSRSSDGPTSGPSPDTPRRFVPKPPAEQSPPEKPAPVGTVTGTITFDGKSLDRGTITFIPADEKSTLPTVGATIQDGKYSIEKVCAGEYKVSIEGSRPIGKKKVYDKPDSPSVDIFVNPIPSRYNEKTLLMATTKEGANVVNFDLLSR